MSDGQGKRLGIPQDILDRAIESVTAGMHSPFREIVRRPGKSRTPEASFTFPLAAGGEERLPWPDPPSPSEPPLRDFVKYKTVVEFAPEMNREQERVIGILQEITLPPGMRLEARAMDDSALCVRVKMPVQHDASRGIDAGFACGKTDLTLSRTWSRFEYEGLMVDALLAKVRLLCIDTVVHEVDEWLSFGDGVRPFDPHRRGEKIHG